MLSSKICGCETRLLLASILAALSFTASASGQYEPGDVIVGVSRFVGFPGESESWIKIHNVAGAFKSQIPLPSRFGMRDLNFHDGSLFGEAPGGIYRIDFNGSLVNVAVPGFFVFDAAGNIYVSRAQRIEKYDLGGGLLGTWSLPGPAAYVDLAADQCTIYYTNFSPTPIEIARYNVCVSQPLPSLITGVTGFGGVGNLRVLPGNDVLLAMRDAVLRIAPNGQITRTYSEAFSQIALDPDGRSFWAASGMGTVRKIDLVTGAVLAATTDFGFVFSVDSITVVDEPRAAVSAGAAIPALSVWLLLALAVAVSIVGLWRLHP